MSPSSSIPPDAPPARHRDIAIADDASIREIYDELRRLASARMAGERADHTLQPTALAHEAWLRLSEAHGDPHHWKDNSHFLRTAALAMRRILVDHARRHASLKRGADTEHLNIEFLDLPALDRDERLVLIDEALDLLEREDPEAARVVTLRFFGGFSNRDIATALAVSERTVERHWAYARGRLMQLIRSPGGPGAP